MASGVRRRWGALIARSALLLALSASNAVGQVSATGRHALIRRYQERYEFLLRQNAPFPSASGFPCNETVGRYCLRYGFGKGVPFRPEDMELTGWRDDMLQTLEGIATELPHDPLVSGPLVRLLLEGGRSGDAVQAALSFAVADTSDALSFLLLGLALTADGQIKAAERAFDRALPRMSAEDRWAATDAFYLLEPAERSVYRALPDAEREKYLAAMWRASDPLYLTSGNETRAEFLARHVYVWLLSRVPSGIGVPRWGEDLEELTRRFGLPVGSAGTECVETPDYRAPMPYCDGNFKELGGYYHPDQLTYVPPEFSRQPLPPLPEPGTAAWFYGPVARRNGFLPPTLRAIRPLEHQLSRFPLADSTVVRVDVAFELDELAPANGPVELGLFVLDRDLKIIGEVRDTVMAMGRFATGGLEAPLLEQAWAYSVEAREIATWQAARSRHELPPPLAGTPALSDLVLLPSRIEASRRGEPAFFPFGSLLLDRDQQISMYLEIGNLVPAPDGRLHYRMDLRIVKGEDRASGSAQLSWTEEHTAVERLPVTVELGRIPADKGMHRLVLTVTDLVSGASSTVERAVKFR